MGDSEGTRIPIKLGRNPLETISPDFGGILAYEVKEDHVVYHEILSELGHRVDVNRIKEAHRGARNWWAEERVRTGRLWSGEAWVDLVERMVSYLTLPNPRELTSQVCELWPYRMVFRTYEDVKPALEELKHQGLRLIVISNVSSRKNLLIYLTRLGLESYFDLLVASGSIGYEKPNPEIFILASKMSKTPFTKMMHVGDRYEEDYLGAESVGIKGVLLDRQGLYRDKRCRKISRLIELLNFI
ncbi:MAG: putative HAD-hydrolase [Candidatus Bathyarchaeota archaeon BA1]|nr:MAG: putative HAD-hydrolase [Candidatus Bathyarchaeota archaeon BA1]